MNDTAEKILDTDAFGGFDIRALPEYAHSIGTGYQEHICALGAEFSERVSDDLAQDYGDLLLRPPECRGTAWGTMCSDAE